MKNWFQSNFNHLLVVGTIFCALLLFFIFFVKNNHRPSLIIAPSPVLTLVPQTKVAIETQNLQDLFAYHPNPVQEISHKEDEVTLIGTGDIIPARSVNSIMVNRNDFTYPFHNIKPILESSDLTFINLESPLLPDCTPTIEGMVFCGSSRAVEGLTYAGVDIASIANNHAGNHGIGGIRSTETLLTNANILVTGNGTAVKKQVKGITFGFLGYNAVGAPEEGIAWADRELIQKQIKALKAEGVQYVVVTFHWGTEYKHDPDQSQIDLAHLAVDSGANLIIGNHPHWVQGVERYKKGFIAYAHGNTIFDQMWSQETREGVIGQYTFTRTGLIKVKYFPLIIENYSQPRLATEQEAKKILKDMQDYSLKND